MRVSPVSFGGLSILESSNKGFNSTRHCPWSPVGQNTFHQESLAPLSGALSWTPDVSVPFALRPSSTSTVPAETLFHGTTQGNWTDFLRSDFC